MEFQAEIFTHSDAMVADVLVHITVQWLCKHKQPLVGIDLLTYLNLFKVITWIRHERDTSKY